MRALPSVRGATEGSRYRESTVEARVCGVAEGWVLRRAIPPQEKASRERGWARRGVRLDGRDAGVDLWDAVAPCAEAAA